MKFLRLISTQSPRAIVTEASLFLAGLIAVDYFTPLEFSMFVFYAAPIFVVALRVGARVGLTLAVVTSLASWLVNLKDGGTNGIYVWRGVNRAAAYVFVASCAIAMRREREVFRQRLEAMEHSRELEQEIVRVSEREQMRIGQDLHDGLCQSLAAIDCAAAVLKSDLEKRERPEAAQVGELQGLLQDACVEARSLARGIFPVQMDAMGLGASLEELAGVMRRTFNLPIVLQMEGEIRVTDPEVAMHLYRIAQEALRNAFRHSNCTEARLNLRQDAQGLVLRVSDNGRGYPEGREKSTGMGLRSMQYRAGLVGGRVEFGRAAEGGAEIRCTVPGVRMEAPQPA